MILLIGWFVASLIAQGIAALLHGQFHACTQSHRLLYGSGLASAGSEVFADDPTGTRALWQANAGLQYAVRDNVIVDASLGRRLSSMGPDWLVNVGITATF